MVQRYISNEAQQCQERFIDWLADQLFFSEPTCFKEPPEPPEGNLSVDDLPELPEIDIERLAKGIEVEETYQDRVGQAFIAYEFLGLKMVPADRKKRPLVKWKCWEPTKERIRRFIRHNVNWAVRCNERIHTLDFDDPADYDNFMVRHNLPADTPVVKTGRGFQLWFKPKRPLPSRPRNGEGVELRGEGGLAIAPPSIHENGSTYQFLREFWGYLPEIDVEALLGVDLERGGVWHPLPTAEGNLAQILGVRPGTAFRCFCDAHRDGDRNPSLGVWQDHGYCFVSGRHFSPKQVLQGLGLADRVAQLSQYRAEAPHSEINARSTAPRGIDIEAERKRLADGYRRLGNKEKAKQIEQCGQLISKRKEGTVKTQRCEDCAAVSVIRKSCQSKFELGCATRVAREAMRGKEELFKGTGASILRLDLPLLPKLTPEAYDEAKVRVVNELKAIVGRQSVCYRNFLVGLRRGEYRWTLFVLADLNSVARLKATWPHARVMEGLTPAQAVALYTECLGKAPQWETPEDLAVLDQLLFRRRQKGALGQAHANSRTFARVLIESGFNFRREPKPAARCPLCGSTNLGRPVYRDVAGVRWFNGIPLWFPPSSGRSPPYPNAEFKRPGKDP